MYVPKAFSVDDPATLERFITEHPFATLITPGVDDLLATHIPLILEGTLAGEASLLGHVARPNEHWRALGGERQSLAIFHGPHAYVSPHWYASEQAVPTWNYAVVHVHGRTRLMGDDELGRQAERLMRIHETRTNPEEPYAVDPEVKARLLKGIVGFVLQIERVEGKFKLSQNRPAADQHGVVAALERSSAAADNALGALMRARLDGSHD